MYVGVLLMTNLSRAGRVWPSDSTCCNQRKL